MRRLAALVILAASVAMTPAVSAQAAGEPGPVFSEPPDVLSAALKCSANVPGATRDPVLLVPGTSSDPSQFRWNWIPALTSSDIPYCTIDLVAGGMDDIQTSGERIAYAIRTMFRSAGRTIDVVGHSQGGMVPRWALKFWPDTRAMVDDLVGIAASNHGTVVAEGFCGTGCAPAIWQQQAGSVFITALNKDAETFAGIDYTQVYTKADEIVVPNFDDSGSTSLHTGAGTIANVAVQDVCPAAASEHLSIGTYDPVGYALARDALDNAGPAEVTRVATTVCTTAFMPGVNPSTFAADYAGTLAVLAEYQRTAARVPAEPPLKCYVDGTCAAAVVPDRTAGSGRSTDRLPATGADRGAWPAAGVLAGLAARWLRRTTSRPRT